MFGHRTLALSVLSLLLAGAPAAADTLDQIKQTGAINIGYRTDAAPFSANGADGRPKGFSVELCEWLARPIAKAAGVPELKLNFVPVSVAERFSALESKKIDLLCEATTVTFKRRETLDFSLMTFATGAGVLVPAALRDELKGFGDLKGRKVGLLAGTTTETGLRRALDRLGISASVQAYPNHDLGLAALESGAVDAYFADYELLVGLIRKAKAPEKIAIASKQFSYEPYALAMRKGEDRLRLAIDRALSEWYLSGAIIDLVALYFDRRPSDALLMLYAIQTIPVE